MGIKNLSKIIDKYSPDSIKYKSINDFKNKKLGIDTNLMMYKIIFAIRRNGYDIKNGDIIVTHIHGFIQKLVNFKKLGIKPIFVFDGVQPELKQNTLENRKKIKHALKLKYENAISQDEKKKYYYHKSDIVGQEFYDVVKLIEIFGYPIINSKEEADMTLADLSKSNQIDGIVTDDMDILVFGGTNVLKGFSVSPTKKFKQLNLNKILKDMNLTQSQLVDIGIIIGCDYCKKVNGIGPITAYKLIKEHGTIEKLIKKKLIEIDINYKKVRKLFLKTNKIKYRYREKKINSNELNIFLRGNGFKKKYIQGIFKELIKH
jgi:flap endonuclease-1